MDSPTYDTKKYGGTDLLHATAVHAQDGTVTVCAVNRSRTESLPLEVALNGLGLTAVTEHSALADADPDARTPWTTPSGSLRTRSRAPPWRTAPSPRYWSRCPGT